VINQLFPNVDWGKMWEATVETFYMTFISVAATFVLGIILGLLLFLTQKGNLLENKVINRIVAVFVNIFRSIPFIILIIILIPLTTIVMNTILGVKAALPSLIIGSAPFYARLVEIALREVDKGVVEAAQSMGANKLEVICKVLLPEAMPALISGLTVTTIALISYTAMAGVIGAGGLGTLAYTGGLLRNNPDVIFMSTILILVIVFAVQLAGDILTRKLDKR
jgi:D-methionine transport system permease protein